MQAGGLLFFHSCDRLTLIIKGAVACVKEEEQSRHERYLDSLAS